MELPAIFINCRLRVQMELFQKFSSLDESGKTAPPKRICSLPGVREYKND